MDIDVESGDELLLELFRITLRASGLRRVVDGDRRPVGQLLPVKPDGKTDCLTDAFQTETSLLTFVRKTVVLPEDVLNH